MQRGRTTENPTPLSVKGPHSFFFFWSAKNIMSYKCVVCGTTDPKEFGSRYRVNAANKEKYERVFGRTLDEGHMCAHCYRFAYYKWKSALKVSGQPFGNGRIHPRCGCNMAALSLCINVWNASVVASAASVGEPRVGAGSHASLSARTGCGGPCRWCRNCARGRCRAPGAAKIQEETASTDAFYRCA